MKLRLLLIEDVSVSPLFWAKVEKDEGDKLHEWLDEGWI
jgi:hypothetical protein